MCYNRTIRTAQTIPKRKRKPVQQNRTQRNPAGNGINRFPLFTAEDIVPVVLMTPNHTAFPVRSPSERIS